MSHTPGPWTCKIFDDGGFCVTSDNGGHRNGYYVVCSRKLHGRKDRTLADARLIASAPDLLQELRNIAAAKWQSWSDNMNTADDFAEWAQNRARAAVAKATGEKP